jgi:hypothetical protein
MSSKIFRKNKCLTMLDRSSTISGMEPKNKAAQTLGRLGGLKGGKARAAKLTADQRKAIAKKAATVRWATKHE